MANLYISNRMNRLDLTERQAMLCSLTEQGNLLGHAGR